jgi:hypothetical protein
MNLRFLLACCFPCLPIAAPAGDPVLGSFSDGTSAPHGRGNLYAPCLVAHAGEFLLYFGAQGRDGHDRIFLATSPDGTTWKPQGVVFAPPKVNHVNDPSVVSVSGTLHLFYTVAGQGVTDAIGRATSRDGRTWTDHGVVLRPSPPPAWDSLLVGRPSVLHDGRKFHLWYDGRRDLPLGAPDPTAPQSPTSRRAVGYATSDDGIVWHRQPQPVFGEDAGGVDVTRTSTGWFMVYESREGTRCATSRDGLAWKPGGLLAPISADDPAEAHGHVTPFLWNQGEKSTLYYGAAASPHWNQNTIRRITITRLP